MSCPLCTGTGERPLGKAPASIYLIFHQMRKKKNKNISHLILKAWVMLRRDWMEGDWKKAHEAERGKCKGPGATS